MSTHSSKWQGRAHVVLNLAVWVVVARDIAEWMRLPELLEWVRVGIRSWGMWGDIAGWFGRTFSSSGGASSSEVGVWKPVSSYIGDIFPVMLGLGITILLAATAIRLATRILKTYGHR